MRSSPVSSDFVVGSQTHETSRMLKSLDMTSIASGGQLPRAQEKARTDWTPAVRVPAAYGPPRASLISRQSTNLSRAFRSRRACQIPNPNQVVHGQGKGEHPAHAPHAAMARLTKQADGLGPAEDLFHPFALLLTDRIAGMARRPLIDGTATVGGVLGHVRRDLLRAQGGDEAGRSYPLSAPSVAPAGRFRAMATARLLRAKRASGSVVEPWVALKRRSPWKSTVGLPGSRGGGRGVSFRRKLFSPAHASIKVPSTVKCSADNRCRVWAWATTRSKKARAILPASNRSRFFVNTVASQIASSMVKPTNTRQPQKFGPLARFPNSCICVLRRAQKAQETITGLDQLS
jgi:hypothetical protein